MKTRKNGRDHGEVFTSPRVVQYILDQVDYVESRDLRNVTILEPSSGDGSFALEIIHRLFLSSQRFNFSFVDSLISSVRFIEFNPSAYQHLQNRIQAILLKLGKADVDISGICQNQDYLRYSSNGKFDCIAGNPPYIRHELIPAEDKRYYKAKFGTFKDRADLYIGFFEHSLKLLKADGKLSFICSNRWLYNQYGKGLREIISTKYNLKQILNIEKASPFDEKVIAYPCIATIENKGTDGWFEYCETESNFVDFDNLDFTKISSPRNSSWQNVFLTYDINHHSLYSILEQGFSIGIGVATGADEIFILSGENTHGIEQSRLLPILLSRDLKGDNLNWGGRFVINPYEKNTLCDLQKYPVLKEYLSKNKDLLLKRHTAKKSPDRWYKTIDKIIPEIQNEPKILLPDLTGNKFLLIDEGKYYPHHNLYYITGRCITDLKILACILMSGFVKSQISQIGIRMNGGLPRFQAQVLKKIRIPNIELIGTADQEILIEAYDRRDFIAMDAVVDKYCLSINNSSAESESVNMGNRLPARTLPKPSYHQQPILF